MQLVQLRTRRTRRTPSGAEGDASAPDDRAAASLSRSLEEALARAVGDPKRVLARPIDVVSYASDASVYRLVPRAVVRPRSESDVRALFALSHARNVPITFRAAGTSLSGQAITNGILVDVSTGWDSVTVLDGGRRVRVQPGAIGGHVNALLRPLGRRIGPDPASIDACMMGGIVANNASGMCCGVAESSYHTLDSVRVVLPSGLVLDTSDRLAGEVLRARAPELDAGLRALRERVLESPALLERIRRKYRIKNTTGYAINALLDHATPTEILAHLMVGSEGTLGFLSEVTLRTLHDAPSKRAGLLVFESAAAAFDAVAPFAESGARAIEFMDDACLRAVGTERALGVSASALPAGACALLVEYQRETDEALREMRGAEQAAVARVAPLFPPVFEEDPARRAALWKLRKGLYPAAGATKRSGETVVIEDVAFPLPRLPGATRALKALFAAHGYDRALLFGHAKDGNCHFVITPSFNGAADVVRYETFMAGLVELVLAHDGSLKAEHGTGRNVAPFVEAEWGADAYRVMRDIKALFDPTELLNPGVLITTDPRAHVTDLKDLPAVDEEIDRCVECGFCEPVCPSRRLTMTPRQRIAVRRELARLARDGGDPVVRASLERDFAYSGIDTCAADGMCATVCPVHIDTGSLVKRLRGEAHTTRAQSSAAWLARRFGRLEALMRFAVRAGHVVEWLIGARAIVALTRLLERASGTRLPKWTEAVPLVPAAHARRAVTDGADAPGPVAIFFPSCMTRVMGRPRGETRSLTDVVLLLAERAGVEVRVPDDASGACCGLTFGSKGYVEGHRLLVEALVDRMWTWTRGGELPVVIDATSCLAGLLAASKLMSEATRARCEELRIVDLAAFVRDTLAPRLSLRRLDRRVVLHPTCASRKLDEGAAMRAVAELCAARVEVPTKLSCCAMAGDRGLLFPELNASATAAEREEVAKLDGVAGHYANNLACEIGMTHATAIPYASFAYLVEEASRPEP
jgi:D-lactate dehydrogenase